MPSEKWTKRMVKSWPPKATQRITARVTKRTRPSPSGPPAPEVVEPPARAGSRAGAPAGEALRPWSLRPARADASLGSVGGQSVDGCCGGRLGHDKRLQRASARRSCRRQPRRATTADPAAGCGTAPRCARLTHVYGIMAPAVVVARSGRAEGRFQAGRHGRKKARPARAWTGRECRAWAPSRLVAGAAPDGRSSRDGSQHPEAAPPGFRSAAAATKSPRLEHAGMFYVKIKLVETVPALLLVKKLYIF
jgi:hypothetical protein